MYTLKSIATRGTALGAAFALVAAAVIPGAVALAAELNPLTERSLLLSSSAPGYVDTDGSNYSTGSPNPAAPGVGGVIPGTYAPAGTGPNGKKTGETFKFNVSTNSADAGVDDIKGLTFQYCTKAAGLCQAPGNNPGDARDGEYDAEDLPATEDGRYTNADAHPTGKSDLEVVGSFTPSLDTTPAAGEFAVIVDGVVSTGWTMDAINLEDDAYSDGSNSALTGKNNFIRLVNTNSSAAPAAGDTVQVIFKPSESIYITNPGDGEFFVKINTYKSSTLTDLVPGDLSIIDGGVTVANMMTDSIHITTKVLETMDFSVGVQNKDSIDTTHGICDPIQVLNNNRLDLGNPSAENSLSTSTAYDTNSFWRLSSNSSGGAIVYYSGVTLSNTVGDNIDAIGATRQHSQPGAEQFGLALVNPNTGFGAPHAEGLDNDNVNDFPDSWVAPSYTPLVVETAYAGGDVASISDGNSANNAEFAFVDTSIDTPEVIAQDDNTVVECATGKVRYVANIAASTPAGVYTTRINYLAAPQY